MTQWIAPSEKDTATETLEKCLWAAARELEATIAMNVAEILET